MKCLVVAKLIDVLQRPYKKESGEEVLYTNGLLYDEDGFKDSEKVFSFRVDPKISSVFLEKSLKLKGESVKVSGLLSTAFGDRQFTALDIELVKS